MTTKLIGLKDFRLNLATYTKEVEEGQVCLIVLKKNKPVLKINPIVSKDFTLESLKKEVAQARKEVGEGKVYSIHEVKKELNT